MYSNVIRLINHYRSSNLTHKGKDMIMKMVSVKRLLTIPN